MHIPEVELHEAETLEQIRELLLHHGSEARILAGGTDLLVDLKTSRVQARHLISLQNVRGLQGVREEGGSLWIGAATTITELHEALPNHERFAALRDATSQMASPQVRNLATVGGNIASAVPCADLPPILLVLHASVELWSPTGTRQVALADFFTGPRQTKLQRGEVLTAIRVPSPSPASGAAYARFALREGNAIAVAGVAAGLELAGSSGHGAATTIQSARVALGAVAPTPYLVRTVDPALTGRAPCDELFAKAAELAIRAASPITDVRGTAEYRRQLVGVLTRRALTAAYDRAKESSR